MASWGLLGGDLKERRINFQETQRGEEEGEQQFQSGM